MVPAAPGTSAVPTLVTPASPAPAATTASGAAADAWIEGKDHLKGRIEALLASKPVMLFMKGSPDAPRCGFSRKVSEARRRRGVPACRARIPHPIG